MVQETVKHVTGDAVIQTAIQMEDLGRDFYDALAASAVDREIAQLCRRLADDESNHRDTFRRIRSDLAEQGETVLLPDEQLAKARRTAREHVLPAPETIRRLAASDNILDLLDVAAQMEKDAIHFYSVIADGLPGQTVVRVVLQEEQNHLRLLIEAIGRCKDACK